MSNIQQDLRSSQQLILNLLAQYQHASEDIIRSNHHNQLHTLLARIASFDHEQISAHQNQLKDEIAIGYVKEIAEKIRIGNSRAKEDKKEREKGEKEEVKEKPPAQKKEEKKENALQKGGLFGFISKFTSKQKKATEMILTQSEEKCYYDPVTRSWIFEGDQPEVPKTIPKPPSLAQKKERQETKKEKGEESQLSQLTAPPAFKRRNTPGTATKSKIKIKEEVAVVRLAEEPMTYARLVEQINISYNNLLEKVESGTYDKHAIVESQNSENWSQFLTFADKTLHMNAQIQQSESKIIEKWSKIITSESRELKIMEKVIREISESANIYSDVLAKIDRYSHRQYGIKEDVGEKKIERVESQCQINIDDSEGLQDVIRRLREEVLQLQTQNEKYFLQIYNHTTIYEGFQAKLSFLNQQKYKISQEKEQLEQQIDKLAQQIMQFEDALKLQQQKSQSKLASYRLDSQSTMKDQKIHISALQSKIAQLQSQIISIKHLLSQEKAKQTGNLQRINAQLLSQKAKIQTQLKFYSEKQKRYFNSVKLMNDQQNIIQDFQISLMAQNQILLNILQSNDTQQSSSILHQLSDIITSITSSHLNRLESFAQCYSKLHSKYVQSKELLSTIRRNATSQSMSLNRSVAKLKSTLEIYKNGKQQVQQRCNYLELECDKLKKKLEHYREEDHFNKSYLSKLKTSKINSQNESVMSLQEDKDELASEIDELQRELQQKDESLLKTQADLEDLLINYEQSQSKLIEFQRRCKQKEKEVKQCKHSYEQLKNKIKLLELKLKNEKERYDEIQNREQNRLKNTEGSFDKRLRLLKNQLQQSYQRQNNLKAQIKQTLKETNTRFNQLHLTHANIVNDMNNTITQKDRQNSQLLQLVAQINRKYEMEVREKEDLQAQNQRLREIEIKQNSQYHEAMNQHIKQIAVYRESQASLNDSMATLIANYSSYKEEQQHFKEHYLSRLIHLQEQLQNSQLQSSELLLQINQYSAHVQSLNQHIDLIKQQQEVARAQSEALLKGVTQENQKLKELVSSQSVQIQHYASMIKQLSIDIAKVKDNNERLSRQRTDLEEKCMFKDRQLETLQNQVNAATEKLMIKTEELLEKERIILEIEETSVTKREEFDELNNQLSMANKQLQKKQEQLEEEIQKNEDLRNCLTQKDEIIQQNTMALQEYESIIESNNDQVSQMNLRSRQLEQRFSHQQTKISVLESKLLVKDQQITTLLEKLQLLQSESKDIAQNDEVQGEMEYLLKEIEARETEVQDAKNALKEKEHELTELDKVVEILESKLEHTLSRLNNEIDEKSGLLQKIQTLTDEYKILQLDKLSLENQTYQTTKAKIQQAEKIHHLQQSLHSELILEAQQIKTSSLELLQDKKIIEDLIADFRFRDELIIDKVRQIQEKERIIAKLDEERERNEDEIKQQEREIRSKASYIDAFETAAEKQLVQLQSIREQLAQKNKRLEKLQNSISEMTEIIEDQDKTIEALRKTEKKGEYSVNLAELQQLKKRSTQLQENNKALLDQNTTLMDEKVELMKSNDYLVAMNQKLVAGKTFTSNSKEVHKAQSQILASPSQKIDRTRSASEIQQKNEPKGFFGALSSLFLTSTEADRLHK